MRCVQRKQYFMWTLRGTPYLLSCFGSILLLILLLGVL